jgi:hypothetical protein
MAAKLRAIPTGATVPSAQAVIGAVASVAPTDEPSVRQPNPRPSAGRSTAEARRTPECRSREPAAEVDRGPGIHQQHHETGGREQLIGAHVPLPHPAARQHQGSAAARVAGAGQPMNPT